MLPLSASVVPRRPSALPAMAALYSLRLSTLSALAATPAPLVKGSLKVSAGARVSISTLRVARLRLPAASPMVALTLAVPSAGRLGTATRHTPLSSTRVVKMWVPQLTNTPRPSASLVPLRVMPLAWSAAVTTLSVLTASMVSTGAVVSTLYKGLSTPAGKASKASLPAASRTLEPLGTCKPLATTDTPSASFAPAGMVARNNQFDWPLPRT